MIGCPTTHDLAPPLGRTLMSHCGRINGTSPSLRVNRPGHKSQSCGESCLIALSSIHFRLLRDQETSGKAGPGHLGYYRGAGP